MSSSQANELVATVGSQKRFGQVERTKSKELIGKKRKESQYKQTKTQDIIFSDISRFEHKPLSGADTVWSLPKLNLRLKYIIIAELPRARSARAAEHHG